MATLSPLFNQSQPPTLPTHPDQGEPSVVHSHLQPPHELPGMPQPLLTGPLVKGVPRTLQLEQGPQMMEKVLLQPLGKDPPLKGLTRPPVKWVSRPPGSGPPMKGESRSGPPPVKWMPRPLVALCGVCSSPASDVQHYGAVACYSCRYI